MKYVILGGTGTLGTALVDKLYGHELVVFSRDELKQSQMAAKYPNVRYVLGDIRDKSSINGLMKGAEAVFHVAALKHVNFGEENPVEFIKTNILGTVNAAEAAIEAGVKHFIFSSTDKSVLAINTYGMTKGISEKYLLSLNRPHAKTKFSVYKWANVLGSRGSVLSLFRDSLVNSGVVNITDTRMTRFFVLLDDVVNFMLETYKAASLTEPMIPKMKSASITALAEAVAKTCAVKDYKVNVTGIRPGEKLHECMISTHDYCMRSDTFEKYTHDELVGMVRKVLV
jgi:UDP-N-acetylglucosamine 4,6-dehydratase